MINLFLDSQIWLDLYSFSNDDLTQFKKLNDMIDVDVKVYLTKQIKDEVSRNRESKIKDSMKLFNDINFQFPNLCKGYDEYKTLEKVYHNFKLIHKDLYRKVISDIEKEELYADKVINELFSKIDIIDLSDDILNLAILRYKLGNPPGKENSYGDAINWEILLKEVPDNEDLFFVSFDRDFRSPLSDKSCNKYLLHEWKDKKNSEIYFYTSLTMFLNEHIKDIKLKSENKKQDYIEELKQSSCFASTHSIVKRLSKYSSWTEDQCVSLFEAADSNNQVYGIFVDDDIKELFLNVYNMYPERINKIDDYHWLIKKLGIEVVDNASTQSDDDSPPPF